MIVHDWSDACRRSCERDPALACLNMKAFQAPGCGDAAQMPCPIDAMIKGSHIRFMEFMDLFTLLSWEFEMQKRLFAFALLFGLGLGHAVAQEDHLFTMELKPIRGEDGAVTMIHVKQMVSGVTPADGKPFSVRAAIKDVGTQNIADRIMNLKVSDSAGEVPLAIENDAPVSGGGRYFRHWRTDRQVAFPVSVEYDATVQPIHENSGPPYGLKATGGGVSGAGQGFLLLPENGGTTASKLHWDLSDLADGSVGVLSAGKGDLTLAGPPTAFDEQWFLAGPAIRVEDSKTHFSAYGLGTPAFDMKTMLEWGNTAYAYLTQTFRYLDPAPPYVMDVRALPFPAFSTGTAFDGGSLIHTGSAFIRNQNIATVENILFHEMTHQWVGEVKGDHSWFSEGLTVYSSTVLPYRGGLMTLDQYVAEINRNAKEYYSNKARNWSQAQVEKLGMDDEEARRVPYDRGNMYYADLDAQILAKSHGKRGLYDMLAPLFRARKNGKTFDQAAWEAALRHELGPIAVKQFHAVVIEGTTTIVPASNAFGPRLERYAKVWKDDDGKTIAEGYEWRPIAGATP